MTAKRAASAHKSEPTIAAALRCTPKFVERAKALAETVNCRHPEELQQDVESILWSAIMLGLDQMDALLAKEVRT